MTPQDSWNVDAQYLSITGSARRGSAAELTSLSVCGRELLANPSPIGQRALDIRECEQHEGRVALSSIITPENLLHETVFEAHGDDGVVLVSTTLTNAGNEPVTIDSIPSLFATLTYNPAWSLNTIVGGKYDENLPPRAYRFETRRFRDWYWPFVRKAGADGRSTSDALVWFNLDLDGAGLMAGLEWSGLWHLTATPHDGVIDLGFGIDGLTRSLAPGASMPLPTLVLMGYEGTIDQGADQWRAFIRNTWMPSVPENWPWVQYNHWYAYAGDIDADRLFEEAQHAAALGCDVFVIDDGWFRGRVADSYHKGWGDWTEDPGHFPDGIKAFSDRVHALGMKFGLWVEPERADHDGTFIAEHPDWYVRVGKSEILREDRRLEGYHLCLGNPDVQDWMIADITRVVQEYGVDWLKWDYNIGYKTGCEADNHGHQIGDGAYAHTLGLYRVLDGIRTNCPELVIENCASGGHRIDLGTMRRTHTNWISDYTHRAASCRQHQQGAGLAMPLEFANAWVLHDRSVAEFRSRYGGAFGVSSHMGRWQETERREFAHAVAEYKRLRPLLRGRRSLLRGPAHQMWDVVQYNAQDGSEMAILAFPECSGITAITVTPHHLQPGAAYRVDRPDRAESHTCSGDDILTDGISFSVEHESELVWITRIEA